MLKTDSRDSFVVEFHWLAKVFCIFFWMLLWSFFLLEIPEGGLYDFKKRGIMDPSFFDYASFTFGYLILAILPLILANLAFQRIKVNRNMIEIQRYFGLYRKKFHRREIHSSRYIILKPEIQFIKIIFNNGTLIRIYKEEVNFMILKEYLGL